MKTNDLIDLLASDGLPVRRHVAAHRLALGLGAALPLSVLMLKAGPGVNPALGAYLGLPMFWVKFGAPLLMSLAALPLVARSGRPGAELRPAWAAWTVPLGVLWLMGARGLWHASATEAIALTLSGTWRVCAPGIVATSLPAFAAAVWALQGVAPVRLRLAGAGAGALAGACGAAVYALHCPELAAPFIAVWYVLGMAAMVAVGAVLGPRLLRW